MSDYPERDPRKARMALLSALMLLLCAIVPVLATPLT